MDPNRLTTGEKLLGASALVLFITSFLSMWGKVSVSADLPPGVPDDVLSSAETNFSLWDGYGILPKLGVLIALLLVIAVIAKAAGALDNVSMPAPLGLVYLGGAAIIVITMLIALLAGPEGDNEVEGFGATVELERGLLLYLGIVLAIATALGAFLHMQGEGSTPKAAAGPASGPPPPRPPGT